MAARLSLALKVLFAKADSSLHVVAGNIMLSVPERVSNMNQKLRTLPLYLCFWSRQLDDSHPT